MIIDEMNVYFCLFSVYVLNLSGVTVENLEYINERKVG
ncbi:hypothetical protein B6N60_03180 [Richelia sinica FACHB-800]|uniref:Uncharacterized protein n=1 Tax=Richelia sinica FACHB-800 TaxID=1357546 RepID=A0A975T9A4_9NOST|nr:hypothetical protein B6N60_03180 [Richelia sinica FACHB-800]